MSKKRAGGPRYWDTSAIIALSTVHPQTVVAKLRAAESGPHLCSSLAHAESCAVLARAVREGTLTERAAGRARAQLAGPGFAMSETLPSRPRVEALAERHSLRGADLWHLACALEIRADEPRLALVSFDAELLAAARAEGLPIAE